VGQYVTIYRIESEDVLILHLIAAARDIEPLVSPSGSGTAP
jgi:hypothetical protein